MIPYTVRFLLIVTLVFSYSWSVAQDEEEDSKPRPARKAYEGAWLIDNQTDIINTKGTLEMIIQHRFGTVDNGASDLWGIYAPGNIRIGFTYSLLERLSLGVGFAKVNVSNPVIDGNAKFKILQQTRGNEIPVNVTYYGNFAVDTRSEDNFKNSTGRLSYFHELIVSRRFSSKVSFQVGGVFSHFNAVDSLYSNDVYGITAGGRFKLTPQTSIMLEWTEPLVEHEINTVADESLRRDAGPNRNISIGAEIATSAHSFQVFFTTYRDNLPQYNLHYNTNAWSKEIDGENKLNFLVGFNITRLWGF